MSTFTDHDEVGYYKLVPVDGPGGAKKGNPHYTFLGITNFWRFSEERMQKMYDEGLIVKKGNSLMQKYYKSKAEKSRQTITTWWDDGYLTSSATSELKKVLWDGAFANPKNESLLELIIEFASKESDIILDFHLGSGTTAAVAHKLNRQYIGCEQIDYQVEISKTRLQKVISGEQGGISQSVHWQGGGSFVYLELAKKNEQAMELITAARSYDELVALFFTLSQRYFLHYNLNIKEFEERVMREETFKALPLERQKEIFARMLDLNQMWVNRDEMNDEQFGLTSEDIVLTDNFYKQS